MPLGGVLVLAEGASALSAVGDVALRTRRGVRPLVRDESALYRGAGWRGASPDNDDDDDGEEEEDEDLGTTT